MGVATSKLCRSTASISASRGSRW